MFSNRERKEKLNAIIHPFVLKKIEEEISRLEESSNATFVIHEAALDDPPEGWGDRGVELGDRPGLALDDRRERLGGGRPAERGVAAHELEDFESVHVGQVST